MTYRIGLSGKRGAGLLALIDDADAPLIDGWSWSLNIGHSGVRYAYGYLLGSKPTGRVMLMLHVLLTGWTMVDHEDGDGLNCQRYNMREVNNAQNMANSRKRAGASSRYKGVTWYRSRACWRAQIMTGGRMRHLGYFAAEEDAAYAYDQAAVSVWGEFARTNVMLSLLEPRPL